MPLVNLFWNKQLAEIQHNKTTSASTHRQDQYYRRHWVEILATLYIPIWMFTPTQNTMKFDNLCRQLLQKGALGTKYDVVSN